MIKSAMADQEGRTKRYEADVAIAQSLRDKESRQAEFDAAVQAKQAEAEQAGPLATAIARQKVTEQETRIDQVRKQQEVLVQEQEAARREQELQATVVKPAEAERQAAILRAEGEKQATVIRAEATQKELEFEGAGEASKIERIGRAEAAKVLAIGEAEAEVIKKKLLAEAEGLQKKAEAWKNFNDAAVLNMVVDKMPELAQAFATQLAGIDKINIIEMGNGNGRLRRRRQGDGHRRRRHDGDALDAEGSVRRRHRAADAGQDRGRAPEAEKTAPSPEMTARLSEHAALGSRRGRTRRSSPAWMAAGTHHFQEFARTHLKAGPRTDFVAVPGGIEPLTLFDLMPKDFNFFRRRLEALVEAHGTRRIVAIAHQDCAWYKARKLGPITIDLRERQIGDLRRASAQLREMFPRRDGRDVLRPAGPDTTGDGRIRFRVRPN